MEQRASYGNRERPPPAAGGASSPEVRYGPEDFPGCEPFHLPAAALEGYEGRLEFWDGRTRTAWRVCEPTTIDHELPTRRLPWLARALTSLRGSEIACLGLADLVCTSEADLLRRVRTFDPPVAARAPAHNRIEGP